MSTAPKTRAVRTPGAGALAPDADGSPVPETAGPTTDADLPNLIDLDPKTIAGPVLTRQGWLLPDLSNRKPPGDALRA